MTGRLLAALVLLAGAAVPQAAAAGTAVAGGIFAGNGSSSTGIVASLGLLAAPIAPLGLDLSIAAAGSASAGTLDLRLSAAGFSAGVGAGIGSFGNVARTTATYDLILGRELAPHVAAEARLYAGPQRPSTLFAGLRFGF